MRSGTSDQYLGRGQVWGEGADAVGDIRPVPGEGSGVERSSGCGKCEAVRIDYL